MRSPTHTWKHKTNIYSAWVKTFLVYILHFNINVTLIHLCMRENWRAVITFQAEILSKLAEPVFCQAESFKSVSGCQGQLKQSESWLVHWGLFNNERNCVWSKSCSNFPSKCSHWTPCCLLIHRAEMELEPDRLFTEKLMWQQQTMQSEHQLLKSPGGGSKVIQPLSHLHSKIESKSKNSRWNISLFIHDISVCLIGELNTLSKYTHILVYITNSGLWLHTDHVGTTVSGDFAQTNME